jgi:amino acid transporter
LSADATAVTGKGLRPNALSFLSSVVIGVASAAPAYSLASALGVIAGFAAFRTPAVLIAAFIPMLFIAVAYFYLNRADPDCGTVFSWVRRAMGPHAGWMGGFVLIVTNILVMPSLAAIAGQYSFALVGDNSPSSVQVAIAGLVWIAIMTAICYLGIDLSARTQRILLASEMAILVVFAAVALAHVYIWPVHPGTTPIAAGWFDPRGIGSLNDFIQAFLVAVFIYWGWDSGVSVNEETKNPKTAPGRAAVVSTLLLVAVYVAVTVAALAYAGPNALSENKADVFAPLGESLLGPVVGKLLIFAVLVSASASTQTTIIPAARTALSMADAGALPKRFGEIDGRTFSPGFSTLVMGGVSGLWFGALSCLSKSVIEDSLLALGLCIAFYYGLTGFACALLHRHELLKSVRNFILIGLLPTLGGSIMLALFILSCVTLNASGSIIVFGIGAPLAIGAGALVAGLVLMSIGRLYAPIFFERRPHPSTGFERRKLRRL